MSEVLTAFWLIYLRLTKHGAPTNLNKSHLESEWIQLCFYLQTEVPPNFLVRESSLMYKRKRSGPSTGTLVYRKPVGFFITYLNALERIRLIAPLSFKTNTSDSIELQFNQQISMIESIECFS